MLYLVRIVPCDSTMQLFECSVRQGLAAFVEHDCTHKGVSAFRACLHKWTSCEHSGILTMCICSVFNSGFYYLIMRLPIVACFFSCITDECVMIVRWRVLVNSVSFLSVVHFWQKKVIKNGMPSKGSYLYKCIGCALFHGYCFMLKHVFVHRFNSNCGRNVYCKLWLFLAKT